MWGRPIRLFRGLGGGVEGASNVAYRLSLDGQQFLMVRGDAADETPSFVVVQHCFEELTARVLVP